VVLPVLGGHLLFGRCRGNEQSSERNDAHG
jgi:hypothetical protein